MTVVGFDFGTTNSLISVVVGERVIDIVDPSDGLPFPSVVRYEGEQKIVGREAKALLDSAGIGVHGNTVMSPKFLLGEDSVYVGGVERSPIDIVHDVVAHVKSESLRNPRARNLRDVAQAVVTIPVDMNGPRRSALRDAFRRADIGIVQYVHEPLAALYGHFRSHPNMAALLREFDRRNVLVVDWGGGTLDLTLCRVSGGRILQVRNSGSDEVGGTRFDEAIREGVIQRFCSTAGIGNDSEIYPDARLRLLHDSEMNKIALSTRSSVTFYRQGFFRNPDATLEYTLTRETLEEISRPLIRSGIERISALLEAAGLGAAQVSLCLVTGGMAAMPAISARLHEMFGPQRVELSENSATLIAQGAAWIAHDRQRLRLAKTIELQLARGNYLPLVPADTEMPVEREVKKRAFHLFCCDPRDGAAKFQITTPTRVGGGVQAADPRTTLGNLVVRVDERAKPFRERLELELSLDDDMILHARAWSADVKDEAEHQYHDLEFSISLPQQNPDVATTSATATPPNQPSSDPTPGQDPPQGREPGDLAIRANIAAERDDYLVPGELLYEWNSTYFDRRFNAPQVQIDEHLYYQPCAVCKRASSDPACRCGSSGV